MKMKMIGGKKIKTVMNNKIKMSKHFYFINVKEN